MEDCWKSKTPFQVGTELSKEDKIGDRVRNDQNEKRTYQQLVGCLLLFSNTTRPESCYEAGYLFRFMKNTTHSLWKAANNVLRYLKGTQYAGIEFMKQGNEVQNIIGYCDED